jgi:hypothetical protein
MAAQGNRGPQRLTDRGQFRVPPDNPVSGRLHTAIFPPSPRPRRGAASWMARIPPPCSSQPAPAGWVTLAAAAQILGIARQTVLHKVQRGELSAIQVTQGRRQGLRIQVEHSQPGLFDTPS